MSNKYPTNKTEVAALVGKVITFNKNVESSEIDFDAGMKARVLGFDIDKDYFKLRVSFKEFEEVNKNFMHCNYYDKQSKPTLKWCETAYYPQDCECNDYFSWGGTGLEGADCFDVDA